ncbi:MAG: DUF4190 domain-containing protein [Actinobacteria bacterium]|nr:DUF4190 domain-containing protein [Actinomycetota bacterium]MCB9413774.1 DUF4190 domain-containing protein [Actinomycetota bacterium]MCB9424742.1 DUF4190 domain-containing protein [Actinomycetota bacterium]
MTNQWQEEPQEEPDFGPPGPADTGDFRAYTPPPPPQRDFVEDSAPQAWNAPGEQWSAPAPAGQRVGSGALVLGVLALLFSFFCALVGLPMAVAAIVMGVKGRQRAQMSGQPAGLPTAGLVLGIIAIVLGFLWILAFLALGGTPSASA